MNELVILSGKGGTGKTSIAASLSVLAEKAVLADCDVDAADLHLILKPDVQVTNDFQGGKLAVILPDQCINCGHCEMLCRFDAVYFDINTYVIDPLKCEGCGVCARFCDASAIQMRQKIAGQWFISDTRHGRMVHARLNIAEDNSGKLVSKIREAARELSKDEDCELIIIDGSPGIGCPVIASVTGAALVLLVSEPTVSGLHDLKRVLELLEHFRVKGMVCINKYDLNPDMADEIEKYCSDAGIEVAGRIPYAKDFTAAQMEGMSIVEYSSGPASDEIKKIWNRITSALMSG